MCRYFMKENARCDRSDAAAADSYPPVPVYSKPMVARKSQQHGPAIQLFSLPVAPSHKDHIAGSDTKNSPSAPSLLVSRVSPIKQEPHEDHPDKKRSFAEYNTLQERIVDLEDKLVDIEVCEKEMNNRYNDLRATKRHSIDVDMKERHNAEIKRLNEELKQKHKAEVAAEKNAYALLKGQHDSQTETFSRQRNSVIEQKRRVEDEIRHIQDKWTPEQMRELLLKYEVREREKKRMRMSHAGAREEKE